MTYSSDARPIAAARQDDLSDLVRIYAWIASLSFATGFLGWFIVHPL